MEAVGRIEHLGSLLAKLVRRQSGNDTSDRGVAVDVIVLVLGQNSLHRSVSAYVLGVKGGSLKGDVKDLIGEIQFESVLLGKIVASGYVDLAITVFSQHLHEGSVELADMALYSCSQ